MRCFDARLVSGLWGVSVIRLFFLFVLGFSVLGAKQKVYDFHFHVAYKTESEALNTALNQDSNFFERKGALLLDFAYNMPVVRANESDDLEALDLHQDLSRLIGTSEIASFGLCGASLRDPNVVEQVKECLLLPSMIGVKLHMHVSGTALQNCRRCIGNFETRRESILNQVAREVSKKGGPILIHFTHLSHFDPMVQYGAFGTERPEERAEAEALLRVAVAHPNVQFVIAHSGTNSMVNPGSFKLFGDYFRSHPQKTPNIFVETSVVVGHVDSNLCFLKDLYEVMNDTRSEIHAIEDPEFCQDSIGEYASSKESEKIVRAWRDLGMRQILFGSDGPSEALTLESLQFIKTNPYLSESEKQQIFVENGKRLFDSFAPPR